LTAGPSDEKRRVPKDKVKKREYQRKRVPLQERGAVSIGITLIKGGVGGEPTGMQEGKKERGRLGFKLGQKRSP